MKKEFKLSSLTSLFLVLGLILSLNVQAQQGRQQGPPQLPNNEQIEKMVDELAETLSLTDEQKEKVSEKYFKHFEEVKEKTEGSRPKREEMEVLKSDFEEDVKSVLTEEQKEKFDAYQKKNQKRGRR